MLKSNRCSNLKFPSDPTSESMSYDLNLRNSGDGVGANPQEFPNSASNEDPVLHKLREDFGVIVLKKSLETKQRAVVVTGV
ncbi:unnamed protein product [Coffea canephora]|uniref:Uncharacterized protein n=1 Tax=Coffea canephora TaxID=49390 RepID=A0A068U6B4_COFCA|nr:unnamed protein product [Coffea canephora]